MKGILNWFALTFVLTGLADSDELTIAGDLLEELAVRPHLRHPKVDWQNDVRRVVIRVEIQAMNAEQAERMVGEELYEVCTVLLKVVDGVRLRPMKPE